MSAIAPTPPTPPTPPAPHAPSTPPTGSDAPVESLLPLHPIHGSERAWPLSNCSLDLWITLLHSKGMEPEAAMGALVELDDEGDHFTFCKFDMTDVERMYGLALRELAVFDRLQAHTRVQTARGNVVLIELDGYHLPDTRSTSYHREHTKTTVGVLDIDPDRRWMRYLHNAGCYETSGQDYDALFAVDAGDRQATGMLLPYTEFISIRHAPLEGAALRTASLEALRQHLALAPARNPFASYGERFGRDLETLIERGNDFFHIYAFNHFRQFGSVSGCLEVYARWLGLAADHELVTHCRQIAEKAKLLQLRVARVVARRRIDNSQDIVNDIAHHWEATIEGFRGLAG